MTVAEVNPEERRMRFDLIGEDIVQEKKQEKFKTQPEKSKKAKPEKEKPIKRPILKPEEDSEQEEEKPKKKAESVKVRFLLFFLLFENDKPARLYGWWRIVLDKKIILVISRTFTFTKKSR